MMTSDAFSRSLKQDLARRLNASTGQDPILLIGSSNSATWGQRMGDAVPLIPGLAMAQADAARGAPLIVDEGFLTAGVWSTLHHSAGESALGELETVAERVRSNGNSVIGVLRAHVPDVNSARLRGMYDFGIDPDEVVEQSKQPRIVRRILMALRNEGASHED